MAASSLPLSNQVPLKSWIAVIGAMLGAFMAVLDIQITNASLKEIQAALGATLEEGSWISTAYLVAEIVVIPLTGWLSRVFSTRWYLVVNAALFTKILPESPIPLWVGMNGGEKRTFNALSFSNTMLVLGD